MGGNFVIETSRFRLVILCAITVGILHLCLLLISIAYNVLQKLCFSVWCTEKVKFICNIATFVGAIWAPRFAEASLGREPATSQVEDLWVSVLPQPAVVQFVPDILDSVCSVDTKSTSTNM